MASNASADIDDMTFDQVQGTPSNSTTSSSMATRKRSHANAEGQQQKEIPEKIAKMETELKIKELEIKVLQAELREQKLLVEHNVLQAKVAKMEQNQLQQRDNAAQTELNANISASLAQLKASLVVNVEGRLSFLLQNSWDSSACHSDLTITGPNSSTVFYKGDGNDGWSSVFAKLPILSTNSPNFYFEVEVERMKDCVSIGFATKAMTLDEMVGCDSDTYGYHSDGEFWSNRSRKDGNQTFSAGDVVGCGVNLTTRQIIYTKNGQRLDTTDLTVSSPLNLLFPCVTLCVCGDKMKANFGSHFQFDVGNL